jgi:hypothetical protein
MAVYSKLALYISGGEEAIDFSLIGPLLGMIIIVGW